MVDQSRSIAMLLQPEVFHVLQVMKKQGTTGRYFSEESSLVGLPACGPANGG